MFSNLKSNFSKFKLAVLSMLMMFIINIIPASFVQASAFINENLLPNQYSEENESTNIKQDISLPMTIEWINFKESQVNLGHYAKDVLQVFKDAEEELDDFKIIVK